MNESLSETRQQPSKYNLSPSQPEGERERERESDQVKCVLLLISYYEMGIKFFKPITSPLTAVSIIYNIVTEHYPPDTQLSFM